MPLLLGAGLLGLLALDAELGELVLAREQPSSSLASEGQVGGPTDGDLLPASFDRGHAVVPVTRVERVLDEVELMAVERCEPLALDHLPLERASDEPARGRLARDDGNTLPGVVHDREGHDLDRGVGRQRFELALAEVPAVGVLAVLLPPGLAPHAILRDDEHADVETVVGGERPLDRRRGHGGVRLVARIVLELLADPVVAEHEAVASVGDVAHEAQFRTGDGVRLERFDHLPLPEGRDDLFPGILAGTSLSLPLAKSTDDEHSDHESGHV